MSSDMNLSWYMSDTMGDEFRSAWEDLKKRRQIGEIVTGKVVACPVHGYFLDIGEPFLAYVDVGLTKRDDPLPSIGCIVSGKILLFADTNRQIRIAPE
jgi:ribosomal protein S1